MSPPFLIMEKELPDDHRGALSQPPPSTFQACVYLPHLHGSFQANHLQQLITQIWKEKKKKHHKLQYTRMHMCII